MCMLPPKHLSTEAQEMVWKVPLPAEALVTNLAVRTVCWAILGKTKGEEGMGIDGTSDILHVNILRYL